MVPTICSERFLWLDWIERTLPRTGTGTAPLTSGTKERELELAERYEKNKEHCFEQLGCGPDGSVPTDDFEQVQEQMQELRTLWIEDETGGPFPVLEGAWACSLEHVLLLDVCSDHSAHAIIAFNLLFSALGVVPLHPLKILYSM